ncbi:hypothetical protein EAF00_012017 [Botryotinia globosa]|nr:hypothetical protein EAF00_012017 [Botryotinia globosa]
MARLWDEKLGFELLWCRTAEDNLRRRPEGLRAPTWSWASFDSPICYGKDMSPKEINTGESDASSSDVLSSADSLLDTTSLPGNLSTEYTDVFSDIPSLLISYIPKECSPSSSSQSLVESEFPSRESAASTPLPPQKIHILSYTIIPVPHGRI